MAILKPGKIRKIRYLSKSMDALAGEFQNYGFFVWIPTRCRLAKGKSPSIDFWGLPTYWSLSAAQSKPQNPDYLDQVRTARWIRTSIKSRLLMVWQSASAKINRQTNHNFSNRTKMAQPDSKLAGVQRCWKVEKTRNLLRLRVFSYKAQIGQHYEIIGAAGFQHLYAPASDSKGWVVLYFVLNRSYCTPTRLYFQVRRVPRSVWPHLVIIICTRSVQQWDLSNRYARTKRKSYCPGACYFRLIWGTSDESWTTKLRCSWRIAFWSANNGCQASSRSFTLVSSGRPSYPWLWHIFNINTLLILFRGYVR